jgi:Aromatic-ring hydroxylase, C-terminal
MGVAKMRVLLTTYGSRGDAMKDDWRHRIDIHTAETDHRPADALLIRPDAYIAWAATIDEPTDTAVLALRDALSSSFGTP